MFPVEYLNCEVCYDVFNEKERKPLSLVSCGHTFCSSCISKLTSRLCPICKTYYNQTITNWTLVYLLPKQANLQQTDI